MHFTGIFGSGMSAIAQYLADTGVIVSGSDRLIGSIDSVKVKQALIKSGCSIHPQDGSGISADTNAVCVSTAIEETNPDIAAARTLGIPILHRSDVLASIVKSRKSVAVAGTSGKSTVTAMIFELLTACGMSPSLISGAALRSLEQIGLLGNSFCGKSDILIIEADESDGTLVKYEPYASVILNLSKDHKPEEEVLEMFARLIKQSTWSAINADDAKLRGLGASTTFGFCDLAEFRGAMTEINPLSTVITINKTADNADNNAGAIDKTANNANAASYKLPAPGAHNASNLMAALCVCRRLGCDESCLVDAVSRYKGVDRRFSITRTPSGVTVIDDFAHNPEKIRAAISAAKNLSNSITAVYQPHGFGPTRFLKNEYASTFKEILRPTDTLCLLPIYYAGGTAVKDICSQDIVALMGDIPFNAIAADDRDQAIAAIKKSTPPSGAVLLMGARDPSLSSFAKSIIDIFGGERNR
jgi:UDP-N-acetylmuramate--alanine ligase